MFASSRSFIFSIIIYRWVRLKDAMPERANSRGFLNPWYSSVSHTSAVCKDGNRQRFPNSVPSDMLIFPVCLIVPSGIILPYRDVARKEKNMSLCSFVEKTQSWLLIMFFCQKNPYAIKILYKTVFPYKSSWKAGNAQLEKFCFPTGKLFFSVGNLFFSSRAVFWGESDLFLNSFKRFFVHNKTNVW